MNEINKYKQLKEIREQIRDLSWSLGDLINILERSKHDDKIKVIIEQEAWKLVEKINEVSSK